METTALILILLPISLLTLVFQFLAIVRVNNYDLGEDEDEDEHKDKERYFGEKRRLWIILIMLINLVGAVLYLIFNWSWIGSRLKGISLTRKIAKSHWIATTYLEAEEDPQP